MLQANLCFADINLIVILSKNLVFVNFLFKIYYAFKSTKFPTNSVSSLVEVFSLSSSTLSMS